MMKNLEVMVMMKLGQDRDDPRDDDEERYSDVDAMFEKKLKNNEIQETFEDAFDDLITNDNSKSF